MTRAITAPELVKLRKDGQWSDLRLLIDAPDTIYSARATGPISATWQLGFLYGSGTLANVLPEMMLLAGSTAGGFELGILRNRKAPDASTFYPGADPAAVLAMDNYLMVVNDFQLFAKHPVSTNMDVDISYSDQFTNFDPVPVFKYGRATVIAPGGTAAFDGSLSWVIGSTITGYAWLFPGATSTTGLSTATPTATYNAAGRYRVKLTVTAANGKTGTGYGWIYVDDGSLSTVEFTLDDIEGVEDDAWSYKVTCYDDPTIIDGARVVLYTQNYYDNLADNIGPMTGRENIVMAGWIDGETIIRVPGYDRVDFEVAGPITMMQRLAVLPAGIQDSSFPVDKGQTPLTGWATMASLTAAKGLHYLMTWRSNLTTVCDVFLEDWGYAVHKLATQGSSLYAQLSDFAGNAAMCVRADRFGQIHIERDGQLYPVASRTANIPEVMTVTEADWQEELAPVRRHQGGTGVAQAEGYTFTAGKTKQVGGRSPGAAPARWGDTDGLSDLNVNALADVEELAGLLAGSKNTEYEVITANLAQNNPFIDVCPRQFVRVTVEGEEIRCFPRRVTFSYDQETKFIHTELELEPEGAQWPAVSIDYPGTGNNPPVTPPPVPPTPPPEPPGGNPPGPEPTDVDAVVATGSDVETSGDLDQASPTWSTEL